MEKVIVQVTPRIVVHIDGATVKELIEKSAFWSMLPGRCPVCNADVIFNYRNPQDYEFYGMKCTGDIVHECTFGEFKNAAKGLYYKAHEPWVQARVGGTVPGPDGQPQQDPRYQYATPIPADPVAKTLSDLVTTKQLGMIRAIERENNLNADMMCLELMKCGVSELSKLAASALIDKLQGKPDQPMPTADDFAPPRSAEQPTLAQPPAQTSEMTGRPVEQGTPAPVPTAEDVVL
jgi:hypothetical protein